MALTLKHQTVAEFVARFREAYRNSDTDRTVQLARFIIAKIQDGSFTETQVRNAFSLTLTQWNNLKTKMNTMISAYNTVRAAAGE